MDSRKEKMFCMREEEERKPPKVDGIRQQERWHEKMLLLCADSG